MGSVDPTMAASLAIPISQSILGHAALSKAGAATQQIIVVLVAHLDARSCQEPLDK